MGVEKRSWYEMGKLHSMDFQEAEDEVRTSMIALKEGGGGASACWSLVERLMGRGFVPARLSHSLKRTGWDESAERDRQRLTWVQRRGVDHTSARHEEHMEPKKNGVT